MLDRHRRTAVPVTGMTQDARLSGPAAPGSATPLIRGIGLSQATALNVNNMIGIGPFITLPLIVADMGGPQALLCWLVGAVVAVSDGMVWAELSSRLPGSAARYVYLRESYGPRWGLLMSFLFIWQVSIQGPLSFAGGCIGFSNYLAYLVPALQGPGMKAAAVGVAAVVVFLLYRRITVIGRMGVVAGGGHAARDAGDDRGRVQGLLLGAPHRPSARRLRPGRGLLLRPGRRVAPRHLRLPRVLQRLLHRRRGEGRGAHDPALDPARRASWWPCST